MKTNAETYTTEELARLPELLPEIVATLEDGQVVVTQGREEVEALVRRYPSNYGHVIAALEGRALPRPSGATQEERELAARYPTMQ